MQQSKFFQMRSPISAQSCRSRSSNITTPEVVINTSRFFKKQRHDQEEENLPIICAICLEKNPVKKSRLDGCVHVFCFNCIREWSKISNQCPLCKGSFRKIFSPLGRGHSVVVSRARSENTEEVEPRRRRYYNSSDSDLDGFIVSDNDDDDEELDSEEEDCYNDEDNKSEDDVITVSPERVLRRRRRLVMDSPEA